MPRTRGTRTAASCGPASRTSIAWRCTSSDTCWGSIIRTKTCSHANAGGGAMMRVDGGPAQGAGAAAPAGRVKFPPQNESLDFRNQLEAKYRDGLRRLPISTSVDLVGDVVWTQEYLRYRV